ncbi:Rieske (2Fe-2S) protein [Actinoplanes sp. TBRC 11911]|uniref:Rieske (2Fe-2S) protein n=1 Tax=Actinoplanes sp. TBRC 11911 TaxID=2729386 RepID=UPI00145E8998|nr:Rieske (2Fe-2S) protein [Actinoplanes sp. TBRC 11911]NMO56727.1 Rieske (2Fe-2S) protein [Actinoplanes sp. TBRC 11911]
MTDVQTTAGELRDEEPANPGSSRRLVLLGAGAVGATTILAACATSPSTTNSTGSDFTNNPAPAGSGAADAGGTGTGGAPAGGAAKTLAAKSDVPSGGGIIAGDYVITQPTAGTFKAFSKVCTHAGCDVNKIDSGVISCPCHGSQYSIETGEPTKGPATRPLPETKVKVDGNNIVTA